MKKMTWIKDEERDYIAYSEGRYYKVNHAIIFRREKKEIVWRNTWTGEEKILRRNISEKDAMNFMQRYMKQHNPD